jgi:leucyl-tRNA synthetase
VEYGVLVESAEFDGMTSEEGIKGIVSKLEEGGEGRLKVNYRLRDWLVSRQRYWGTPIPIIYCDTCGAVPVPESDLPVELPYDVEFTPDGESPLKKSAAFINTVCPKCGRAGAKRDPDTLDTFVCSSWYHLRYLDNKNSEKIFDIDWINRMMPVDIYVGGAEHAAMHLLYARFIHKALRDMGYLKCDEPYARLVHQGVILSTDGNKMSKSLNNTVSPDDYVRKFGSDVFRMYLGFGFSYTDGGPWNDDGIKAVDRFLSRVERFMEGAAKFRIEPAGDTGTLNYTGDEAQLNYVRHNSIKFATLDIEKLQFNTAISKSMELLNALNKYDASVKDADKDNGLYTSSTIDLIKLIAPFAPHFAEEMWEAMGLPYSVFNQKWPEYDEAALVRDVVELAVQINGVVRFKIEVPSDMDNDALEQYAREDERLIQYIAGKTIAKVIVIRSRLVNIVL